MAKDPYWNSVVCLLHCDDLYEVVTQTNASVVGAPVFDINYKVFGSKSLHVTTGNYITLPYSSKWLFGSGSTGAFTIEFFMRYVSAYNNRVLMGHNLAGYPKWQIQGDYLGRPQFQYWTNSSGYQTSPLPTTSVTDSGWYAVCIQRDTLNQITVWVNKAGTNNNYSIATAYPYDITGGTGVMQFGSADADLWFDEIRITKGVARYTTASYAIPTEPFPESNHEIYPIIVSDTINSSDRINAPGGITFADLADAVTGLDLVGGGYSRALLDKVFVTTTPLDAVRARVAEATDTSTASDAVSTVLGTVIRDFAKLAESHALQLKHTANLSDLARVLDAVKLGVQVAVQDTATVAWALSVVQGVVVAERLGISEVLNFPFRYGLSAADAIRVYDALANFFHFEAAESITVTETTAALARFVATLSDPLTATAVAAPKMVISAVAHDDAVLDDAFSPHMIYRPEVHERVVFTVMFASPSGGVTTWAVNTRTGAVTEYENYGYNSFASLGVHYLGASASGLYALDGDDDAGTDIIARIKSGYAQFGSSRFTSFKAAYLGIRGAGDIYLKMDTADGRSYTYKTVIQDQQTTKVRLGKGLRARYFAFELITEGQDFDLDTVEFIPLVATRRV